MTKAFLGAGIICTLLSCNQTTDNTVVASVEVDSKITKSMGTQTFYDFTPTTLTGESLNFSDLKGKRVLIVNTASKCGFTPQYEQLQELYDTYGGEKFTVVGFPSNDFGKQEPGSNEEIASFCQKNYGVTFPMMDKIVVKGDDKHPLYAWLTQKELNGIDNAEVRWNFNKFLVDENGKWIAHYGSRTSPMDEEIIAFASGK